jgi:antitoxin HicB
VHTYSIVVDPDGQGGFTVTVPSLPGCITQGDTIEQCLEHAEEAVTLYLEELKANGRAVPD